MTEGGWRPDDEISLFGLGSVLLQHRWRIAQCVLLVGLLAVIPVLLMRRTWTASASFVPQGVDAGQSGLRSLAGQFGVLIPGGGATATQSPDFYRELVTSPTILGVIVSDTMAVAEEGGARHPLVELLDVTASNPGLAREQGIRKLSDRIETKLAVKTGVVRVSVKTAWPSVSLAIAERVLGELNRFNLQTRQSQAAEERRFVEERLASQRQSLAEAEARLARFLRANRQFQNSPDLMFEHDRIQRDVDLQQQVLVGLAQSYEEARIREVRDVPVITAIEAPRLPVLPDPRRLVLRGLFGALLGGFLGVLAALAGEMFERQRAEGDKGAERFATLLGEIRQSVTRWMRPRSRDPHGG